MRDPLIWQAIKTLKKEIFRQKWLRIPQKPGQMHYTMLENIVSNIFCLTGKCPQFSRVDPYTQEAIYNQHCPIDRIINTYLIQTLKENLTGFRIDLVIDASEREVESSEQCVISYINSDGSLQTRFGLPGYFLNDISNALKVYSGIDLMRCDSEQDGGLQWDLLDKPGLSVTLSVQTIPSDIKLRNPFGRGTKLEPSQTVIVKYITKLSDRDLYWLINT